MTLSWEWAEERLRTAHNYWLATVDADTAPYVRPVWCVWADAGLLFTMSPTSRKARNAARNEQVSVQLELDREVVVVDGVVARADPAAAAIDLYVAKYAWRPPDAQQWYRVTPRRIYVADEATYPESAATFSAPWPTKDTSGARRES